MVNHAVILAAGMGTRLKPITDSAPKCLTEVNGVPILLNTLKNLHKAGIQACTIVVGHFSHTILDTLGSTFDGLTIEYIKNEQYKQTNDMYSLWLARDALEAGAVIIEGDIFFRADLLPEAITHMGAKSFYICGRYDGRSDEILIETDNAMRILSIDVLRNRASSPGPNRYMSSGILVIQEDYGRYLSCWLTRSVESGDVRVLFDDVISSHIDELPLYVQEIAQSDWVEIDTHEDLGLAERTFYPASL